VLAQTLSRAVKLGIRSLMLHRLRSLLTTLGVLFGTSSVIAMLAIGEGASAEAYEQIKQLGSQNVILRSVKPADTPGQSSGGGMGGSSVVIYGITHADQRRIEETFPAIADLVPVRELSQEVRHRDRVATPRVLATASNYVQVTGRLLLEGRFLDEEDERLVANVCVLGGELARHLFPSERALGREVRIGPNYFTVVGILAPRMRFSDDPADAGQETTDELLIPLTTGRKRFGELTVRQRSGSREMEQVELHELILAIDDAANVPLVASASRRLLATHHPKGDYEVVVPLELLARAEETKRIFNIVLSSIAGISLLVGGIGIMNVMLATVTERTREIGIRRALGAKRRHIVLQFLVECVVLSVVGGAMGVGLGLVIPIAVEYWADMRTIVTPLAPILAFTISAGIGIVFGIYPAWRAAAMDPVEALRHE
jgi:putative ABC transport system permease protein